MSGPQAAASNSKSKAGMRCCCGSWSRSRRQHEPTEHAEGPDSFGWAVEGLRQLGFPADQRVNDIGEGAPEGVTRRIPGVACHGHDVILGSQPEEAASVPVE